MTQRIVSVSSGLGSAFVWKLWCEQYGADNVVGVFTDVNGEHPDNYRFLAEVQYALGSRLVKITNGGRTIWDVFIENRFLGNTRVDVCSRVLKRDAFKAWLKENVDPEKATIALGIDWQEIHRFDRARPLWSAAGYRTEAPLCDRLYDKKQAQAWIDAEGIRRPALYDLGFSHANCGGGCIKAGIKQFKHLLEVDRKWYVNWWEAGEERVKVALGRDDIAILRDRRGGVTKPLPLRVLREQIDAEATAFADVDDERGCGVCFLGDEQDEPIATPPSPTQPPEPTAMRYRFIQGNFVTVHTYFDPQSAMAYARMVMERHPEKQAVIVVQAPEGGLVRYVGTVGQGRKRR